MRWVHRGRAGYVLQVYVAEINGYDESGGPHYTGRGDWHDVPIVEDNDEALRPVPKTGVERKEKL